MSDNGRDLVNWTNVNADSVTNITPSDIVLPRTDRPCTEIVGLEVGGLDIYGSAYLVSNETFTSSSKPFTITFNLYSYGTDIRYVNVGYQIGTVKNISAVFGKTGDNTQVTYETSSSHGFSNGDYVTVSGTVPNSGNPGAYDQAGIVEVVNSTRFRIDSGLRYREILALNEPGGEAFKGEMADASDAWLSGLNDEWHFLSANFDRSVVNAKIRLKIFYDGDYEKTFLINGIDIGQDSAQFSGFSSGQTPVALPLDIATDETYGIIAEDYLTEYNKAYYIVKDNILCTQNSSIPMVYGSSNTTVLSSNNDGPSLIVPGFGLLNDYGKDKTYNLETFIRINGNVTSPKRIIGPLQSNDGIYIDGSFITLKVGNLYKSVFIGEWFKVMLLNLQYTRNTVELWINAEKLISLDISNETLAFPEKIATSGTYVDKDQDWIGFYSYDELSSIEIDTIAIYPYTVDQIFLKKRLLYAQAIKTGILENKAIQNNGKLFHFQYPSANHNKNYNFPTSSKWNSARVFDNLTVKDNALCNLTYSLPTLSLSTKTETEWISEQYAIQDELTNFISLKPDSSYDNLYPYMYFDNLNILSESISSIYAVVKKLTSSVSEQRLLTIYDDFSKNYFKVSITGSELSYIFNYNGEDTEIYATSTSTINTKIAIGINLDTFRNSINYDLSSFFKEDNLKLYIGGMPSTEFTFDGHIYKLGVCNRTSSAEISSNFNEDGIILPESSLENNVATYTLFAEELFDNLILNIKTKSYWESSVPLANLSSYYEDILDLDFFQLNFDYPEATTIVDDAYDTSNELVKTYISFQSNDSGLSQTVFSSITPLPVNRTIDARTSWANKKYEFIDHTLVYVPSDINVENYSVVIHMNIVCNVYTKPIKIKYLELAAKTLEAENVSTITSISGNPVEHYSLDENGQIDYKNNAGILITKESTSYLNLNNKSGIQVGGIE
jgi:hypothetical protein